MNNNNLKLGFYYSLKGLITSFFSVIVSVLICYIMTMVFYFLNKDLFELFGEYLLDEKGVSTPVIISMILYVGIFLPVGYLISMFVFKSKKFLSFEKAIQDKILNYLSELELSAERQNKLSSTIQRKVNSKLISFIFFSMLIFMGVGLVIIITRFF